MNYPDFSILIATKDRPESVRKLLTSLERSTIKPTSLVIISSGLPIDDVIFEFDSRFAIDYFHSEVTGQVNQKKIGITKLRKGIPWVVFLDDDLIVAPDAFEKAFETLSLYNKPDDGIVGIGLGLTPTSRLNRSSRTQKFLGLAFLLSSSTPGKVLGSGQGVSYLESTAPIFTEWLNGASIWSIQSTVDYSTSVPSSRYAACEDLVFSYQQSKKGKLLFAPEAKIYFQDTEPNDYNRSQAIISGAAWRYYFVKSNPELSQWKLMYSQVGRLAYILMVRPWNQAAIRAGVWSVSNLFSSLVRCKEPTHLINKIG